MVGEGVVFSRSGARLVSIQFGYANLVSWLFGAAIGGEIVDVEFDGCIGCLVEWI